jgi:hypothetical protein
MLERMDFDIGTLIYIVITLVAVIAGAFSQKKKPAGKPSGGEAEPSASSGNIFSRLEKQFEGFVDEAKEATQEIRQEFISSEEALEEIRDDDFVFAEEVHEERQNEEKEPVTTAFAGFEGTFDPELVMNRELIEAEANRSTELQVIELDEELYADYYEIVEDFDLGTAVIYSAIINRPDY